MTDGRNTPLSTVLAISLIGIVFVVAGVALFSSMDGIQALVGVTCAVMGAVCLVIAVGSGALGSRRVVERPVDALAEPKAAVPPRGSTITYKRSRGGYLDIVVSVGASIFVSLFFVIGLALMGAGEPAGAGFALVSGVMWFLIVPGTVLAISRLATDRTVLVLDPAGVRIFGIGWIPWADIARMSIEDTTPLVAEPGTQVMGSMRQLAFELRPGAVVPEGNTVDRALRAVSKGFLALGQAAGRGRYQWLAVRERELGVPLEDVLDVATVFHARVVGVSPEPETAAEPVAAVRDPEPALAPVPRPAAASVGELAAEAAAIRSNAPMSSKGPGTSFARRASIVALGGIALAVVMALLGRGLVTGSSPGPLPPWQFIAFALVTTGLQFGYRAAGSRSPWLRRPLGTAVALSIGAFVLGAFSGAWHIRLPDPLPAPTPIVATTKASSEMQDFPISQVVDRNDRNMWNSGRGAPGWIKLDLKEPARVTAVRLLVEQTPSGPTLHRLYVSRDDETFDLVFEFSGHTSSGQWLSFHPESAIDGVRSVVIHTVESPSWVAWREIEIE